MFERVTGFFRRFRSKRKTSETVRLDSDEAPGDEFGLDTDDFGDVMGTDELGVDSFGDEGFGGSLGLEDAGAAEVDAGAADVDAGAAEVGSGAGEPDSLTGMDTFETITEPGDDPGAAGSLAGGSGESLLDDSLGQADTFDSLGGLDDSGGDSPDFDSGGDSPAVGVSDSDAFGDEFGDFAGDLDAADLGTGPEEEAGADVGTVAPAAAGVRVPVVAGAAVGALVVGAVLGLVVLPMLTGAANEIPLDQQLAKVKSDLRKGESELSAYNALGGLGALEQLRVDLATAKEQYDTLETLEAAVQDAQAREQAYDTIVQETRGADETRRRHDVAREALGVEIVAAEAVLADRRRAVVEALAKFQRGLQAMEASAVVSGAFEAADERYARERAAQMLTGPARVLPAGE